jgi:hypothetical protein
MIMTFIFQNYSNIFYRIAEVNITEEYRVSYKNGVAQDTILISKSKYNSKGNLESKITFFRGKVEQEFVYLHGDSFDLKKYTKKHDNLIYEVRNNATERRYYNGELINESFFDKNNNVVKIFNYNYNSGKRIKVTEIFNYEYSKNKIILETSIWNNDTLYQIEYRYNKDSLIREKYYIKNRCCEGNQPIPEDRIVYGYDSFRNMTKEVRIIDKNIKRGYKVENKINYSEAVLVVFSYDNKNRLTSKKIYSPVINRNQNIEVKNLGTNSLSEEYFFKYSTQ